jgi:hypothetical protein
MPTPIIDANPPTQDSIDRCASAALATSADIAAVYSGDFIAWFNETLAGRGPFGHRGRIDAGKSARFGQFWELIAESFGKPSVSTVEFCALMAISLQETGGIVAATPEESNPPWPHLHPGIAYFFDAVGEKHSYNLLGKRVSQLLVDPVFLAAHGALPGAQALLAMKDNSAWAGDTWPALPKDPHAPPNQPPQPAYPTTRDEQAPGCIMQADFCKFCGRGFVQTTARSAYMPVVKFIMTDPRIAAIAELAAIQARWAAATGLAAGAVPTTAQLDTIATASSFTDWNTAFDVPLILAHALATDSAGAGHYLDLHHDAATLNGSASTAHSLRHIARCINGGSEYAQQVPPMMFALINATASLLRANTTIV